MLKTFDIDVTKPPTQEQLDMLDKAAALPIPADAEYPEFSAEELKQFRRIADSRRDSRNKQVVALRLSPRAMAKAKSLGKGYTSILSRILENALNDPEIIKQNL